MKRKVMQYFALIVGFVCLLAILHFWHFGGITGFVILQDSTQGNFDGGTYSNTTWNGSAVALSGANLSGMFTSRIFDAGDDAVWNNLTWSGGMPSAIGIYTGDAPADIWKSFDGTTWDIIKDDYNNGDSNGGTDIEKNSTHLFILYNQDLWTSSDKGVSWTKINDDHNGGEGQNGDALAIDSSNRIYIVEGDQDVWRSTNGGTSFSKVATNFNGGNGAVLGMAVNSTGAIFAADLQADIWVSLNQGVTWTLVKDDYNGAVGNGVDDLVIDSANNLYLVDRQDFWRSTDKGVSWSLMNDDLNGAGDSNDGLVAHVDEAGSVYVIDGSEDVFKSVNNGTAFTLLLSNFNGGSGNVFGLNSISENSTLTFEVRNCSSSNCAGSSWQVVDLEDMNIEGRYFQYRVNFSSPDDSVSPYLTSVAVDYTILNSPPSITLAQPQDGSTYGYNESIDLEFSVSDTDGNIDSCWYQIDGGVETSISNCENTTFDVSGSGSYTLQIFVNDSDGEESSDNADFNVQIGAPSIVLNSPVDSYLNSGSVLFRYTPEDIDLQTCSLLGDFNGAFSINQTDSSVTSGVENTFSLTLPDGTYSWNVKCNDSIGNEAYNGNKTFHVDTDGPVLTLSQPSGTKTSRENISVLFSVDDESPVFCLYNVFRGASLEVANTSVSCDANNETFDVTVDANFVLNFYVNDSAGNRDFANSSFTVDTSVTSPPAQDGGSGGRTSFTPKTYNETTEIKADFEYSDKLILKRGTGTTFVLEVTNKESIFLNACSLEFEGQAESWFSSAQTMSLGGGQRGSFDVVVFVPAEAQTGLYRTRVILQCDEGRKVVEIEMVAYRNSFEAEITNYERRGNDLAVDYSITEFSGEEHDMIVSYELRDFDGVPRYTDQFVLKLLPHQTREEEIVFALPKDSFGEFTFIIRFADGLSETEASTEVFLPSIRTFTGLSVSENEGTKLSTIGFVLLILIVLALIIWVITRLVKKKKREHLKKSKRFSGKRRLMEIEL